MPSGPVVIEGSRPDRTFSTFSGENNTESSRQWVQWGKMWTERDGLEMVTNFLTEGRL